MSSVSGDILALQIRHHIDVHAYSNGLVRSIIGQLNDANAELVDMIRKRGEKGPFTTARLNAMVEAIQQMNADNYAMLYNELETPLFDFSTHEAESSALVLEKSIPIALDIITPDIEKLKVMVSDSAIHGHLLKEWFDSLETSMSQKVTQQIRLGVIEGESISKITSRLTGPASDYESGIFGIVRRQTEAVVRTAVNNVSNQAAAATYKANADIIKGETWVATLDKKCCVICGGMDGKVFDLGTSTRPPIHLGDRCFMVPVLKSWREMGINIDEMSPSTRASMNGHVPEATTYDKWLRDNPEYAKDVLGVTKAKLFLDGGMPIERFVNDKSQVLTLPQLRERQSGYFTRAGVE